MNIALWIVQGLLAALFAYSGFLKSTQPISTLSPKLPWVNDFPVGVVRFIGITQLLASLGLILPQLTGIAPILTPLAAMGIIITMVLALGYHLSKKEYKGLPINGTLMALAAFVAYGRVNW